MKRRPLCCLPLELTPFCLFFCVFLWEKSSAKFVLFFFLSVSLRLSATRGAVSIIVFSLTTCGRPERRCSSPHPVNMCDYIYFVHSYDGRMILQLAPGWADGVTLVL